MIEELTNISSGLMPMHIFCMQFLTACSFLSHAALIGIHCVMACHLQAAMLGFSTHFTWDGKTCSDEKNIPFRNSTHFSPSWCPESPPKISKSGHYGILRKGLFRFFCLLRTIFSFLGHFWAVFGPFLGWVKFFWSVDIMGVTTDQF